MALTPQEVDALSTALATALEKSGRQSSEAHADHHRFVEQLIEERQARTELWHELRDHLLKWGMIGVLTGLAAAVWFWLKHNLGATS
jgi:hypothetical protein